MLRSRFAKIISHSQKIFQSVFSFLFRNSPDGKHTVFKGTSNQAEVFCDMSGKFTGCKGGGWTLVMRTHGERVYKLKKNNLKKSETYDNSRVKYIHTHAPTHARTCIKKR